MLSIVLATHNEIDHKTYITRWKMKEIRAIIIIIIYLACEDISPLDTDHPIRKSGYHFPICISFSITCFCVDLLIHCIEFRLNNGQRAVAQMAPHFLVRVRWRMMLASMLTGCNLQIKITERIVKIVNDTKKSMIR